MEHSASAAMDELNRIRMQGIAIKAEEATDAENHISAQEPGEEIRRRENASYTLVNYLESKLHTQRLGKFLPAMSAGCMFDKPHDFWDTR